MVVDLAAAEAVDLAVEAVVLADEVSIFVVVEINF